MKNIKNKKNFTLLIVAVLILGLSLSCKSNEEPAPEIEIPTLYHGIWVYTDDTNTTALDIKSNNEGFRSTILQTGNDYGAKPYLQLTGSNNEFINVTKNSDTSFTASLNNETVTFEFTSSTTGTIRGNDKTYSIKKQ